MNKVGRNDPCPCGSGQKYKQCCLLKKGGSGVKRKITAKWLNTKVEEQKKTDQEGVDLMERTFGHAVESQKNVFHPVAPKSHPEGDVAKNQAENAENV